MNAMLIQILVLVILIVNVLVLTPIEGNLEPNTLHQNVSSVSSPWLKKNMIHRDSGCRGRAWVCNQGGFRSRIRCCRNRCVNVTSDNNNCGLCRIRCPFNWRCCGGLCRNINLSIFNCGRCGHRCPFGVLCLFGMCGYSDGPPSPFLHESPKNQSTTPPDSHQPHQIAKDKFN
ncbi:hypothetical protein VNO77_43050 [Canavalia gladiata]|uniref:Stigma-specific Stig1 family protein n=1 Tax=Canavalia gladiata TaxID=3824 RepID=A0AAN9PML0_CANGL